MSIYAKAGVAQACLRAQERWNVDVNLMLYATWCAEQGVSLSPVDLGRAEECCRQWREAVVLPLRHQRGKWRELSDLGAEYAAIKTLELQAERIQLEFLADCFDEYHGKMARDESAALSREGLWSAQLAALVDHYGLEADALREFQSAIDAP